MSVVVARYVLRGAAWRCVLRVVALRECDETNLIIFIECHTCLGNLSLCEHILLLKIQLEKAENRVKSKLRRRRKRRQQTNK